MKPQDLRTLAELLLDLQDVLRDNHHHPVHDFLLDNSSVKAYAATVELVDFISEEIAILEKAGVLEPVPVDPEADAAFDEMMQRIFELDSSEIDEIKARLQIDPEIDELPDRPGKKIYEATMALMAQKRADRWKNQPEE